MVPDCDGTVLKKFSCCFTILPFFFSVQIVVFHFRHLILRETLTYWNMSRGHVKVHYRFKSWRNQECFPWWKEIEGRHDRSIQTSEDFPRRTVNRIVISSLESSWRNMQEDEIHFRRDFSHNERCSTLQ